MTSENPHNVSYGAVAAELLRQGQNVAPGLHTEVDPPPQPAWVAAVEGVLDAGEAWVQDRGATGEINQLLEQALTRLRAAWNS